MTGNATSTCTPTLSWELPSGFTTAHVDVCKDRACNTVYWSQDVTGNSVQTGILPRGMVFWRLFTKDSGGTQSTLASPTWQFAVLATLSPAHMTTWWNFADMEGDGHADAIFNLTQQLEGVTGSATGLTGTISVADSPQEWVAIADVNGDGLTDVIGADNQGSSLNVFLGSASGLPNSPSETVKAPAADSIAAMRFATGDMNGDGYADVAVYLSATGTIAVYDGSASGLIPTPSQQLARPSEDSAGDDWRMASAGDVNADGYADVIASDSNVGTNVGHVYVYLGSASGLPGTPSQTLQPPNGAQLFGSALDGRLGVAGDVNGDGYADILLNARAGGVGSPETLLAYQGGPTGLFLNGAVSSSTLCPSVGYSVGGVYTGGAASELLVYDCKSMSDVILEVYFSGTAGIDSSPSGSFSPTAISSTTRFGLVGWIGDVNGDGQSDFAVGADSGGQSGTYIYYSSGALGGGPSVSYPGIGQGQYAMLFSQSSAWVHGVEGHIPWWAHAQFGAVPPDGLRRAP